MIFKTLAFISNIALVAVISLVFAMSARAGELDAADEALRSAKYQEYVDILQKLEAEGSCEARNRLARLYFYGRIVDLDEKKAVELWQKSVDKNDAEGMRQLAWCLYLGEGIAKDRIKAREYFAKARELGCVDAYATEGTLLALDKNYANAIRLINEGMAKGSRLAFYALGGLYTEGWGLEKDLERANDLFREAIARKFDHAHHQLGLNLVNSKTPDYNAANESFKKGAEEGDPDCQFELARNLFNGKGCDKDESASIKWIKLAASQNYPPAMRSLSLFTLSGMYVDKDEAKAVELMQKSADRGWVKAQLDLGDWYQSAWYGLKEDKKRAFELYLKAAKQGDSTGQYSVGRCFEDGDGVPKDNRLARHWYEAAIAQGNPHACHQLGRLYRSGTSDGIARDFPKGVALVTKGAELGCPFAQACHATDLQNGTLMKKDMKEAIKWLEKSAAQERSPDPYARLALIYETGNGVPVDKVKAIKYYREAAKQGDKKAAARIKALGQKL